MIKDRRCRNINLLSIAYAFRPRLRSRLTLGGFTFPRKPWAFGDRDSHLRLSLLKPAYLTSCRSTVGYPSQLHRNAPLLPSARGRIRSFGTMLIPDHFRRRIPRPVSCYALFKWWLLLSQHPGCHEIPLPFQLSSFGTLAGGLGCFPFDHGNYPRGLTPVIHLMVFGVWLDSVGGYGPPSPIQCSTPIRSAHEASTSMHFGENEISPGLIRLSLLPTAHPPLFNVRCTFGPPGVLPPFNLAMGRSPPVSRLAQRLGIAL
jgi:hypothetical protein